jgi:hypothetical protein
VAVGPDGIQNLADTMKAGLGHDAEKSSITRFLNACAASAKQLKVDDYFLDSGTNDLQTAMIIRAIVMERIGHINEMITIALSRGYLLPDSPFLEIERINQSRSLFDEISIEYNPQVLMMNSAKELSDITKQYKDGKITFDRKPAAQIASYEISVDGMAPQSGDALTDILGYQPDGDYVKRKRAIDSLLKLDFSKRKPYLLFTLETPTGGIVVCWGKMRDASGYTISRRDVFYGDDLPDLVKSNAGLTESTNDLLNDEQFFQALSFYDWTTARDVFAFVDDSIVRDTLYSYRISGIQKKAPASPFIFDVPMNALLFSPALLEVANASIREDFELFGRDPASVSPYPAIAKAVYGDTSLGWIIAGCNILASIRRNDPIDQIRANSYIGSTAERIFAEAKAGRLFIPSDVTKVQAAVESAVSSYGVSQTILSVLDGTGATNFVSGKDDPNGIQATQQSVEGSTGGLARILSAIDPETATLDPKLIVVGGKGGGEANREIMSGGASASIDDVIGTATIDLTTYVGIGRFMQLLRTLYDFYPGAFV